jgi:Acetyl-CoA acetyltransferase
VKDVVIVSPLRTPVGAHGGALRSLRAQDLAAIVFKAVLERTGIDPGVLDEVILGNIGQPSDAANIGRVAALMAGVPIHVPGFTVQRNCASGIQAITSAYQAIQAGDGEIYLVGGTESMSNIPYILKRPLGVQTPPRRSDRRPLGGPHRSHLRADHGPHR